MNQHYESGPVHWLCGFAVVLSLFGRVTHAGDDALESFDVYVDQEEVTARCGPGGQYYRTDPLRHGQRLEVYLETDDGWLGIRPPTDSFSWIMADAVQPDRGERSARVLEEGTLCWIGTHLGTARKYMWQVQLSEGEEVLILGKAERQGADGPQLWYRIAPPAGEFRWIHRDQVVDNPELLLRTPAQDQRRVATTGPTPLDDDEILAERPRPEPQGGLLQTARSILQAGHAEPEQPRRQRGIDSPPQPLVLHPLDDAEAMPLVDRDGATRHGNDSAAASESSAGVSAPWASAAGVVGSGLARASEAPLISVTSSPVVRPIGAISPEGTDAVRAASGAGWEAGARGAAAAPQPASGVRDVVRPGDSVDELQLQLSRQMVGSASAADVQPLRDAAERIATTSDSPTERQRAKLVAQRIESYQSIARRRDGEPINPAAPDGEPATALAASQPGQVNLAAAETSGAEAAGYLVQVFSSRPDSPPFALTDAAGRTTHYVSPTPGFNLRRYLNQHIVVGGQAGYETGLDTPHLTVSGAVRSPAP